MTRVRDATPMTQVSPPRCAVVRSPAWPLIAAVMHGAASRGPVFDAHAPLATFHAQRVVCCSPAAWREGVRPGQRRRQAQGACPHLVIVPADPERDALWFESIARSVGTLVPLVDVDTPGTLLLATRGPSRYVGGDESLAQHLVSLSAAGVDAVPGAHDALSAGGGFGVGIADGRVAALLAARRALHIGEPVVVPPGHHDTTAFLAPHPVRRLAEMAICPPDVVGLFERLGLRTFGDVAAVPVADLTARFGSIGEFVHRVVTARDDTPPSAIPPPPDVSITRLFEDSIQQLDRLVFAAKSLVDEVCARITDHGQIITRCLVEAESEHGETSHRVWYRAEGLPATALLDRVRWQLDGWVNGADPPSAGVSLVRITPTEVIADAGVHDALWGGRSQADDNAARAIARVMGLMGPTSVTMASWRGGRDPRQMFEMVPVADLGSAVVVASEPTQGGDGGLWPGALPAPSPATVHVEPVPVDVLDHSGRVVQVNGRGVVSAAPALVVYATGSATVSSWAGPWPIDERWWDPRARRAARFQMVVSGDHGERAHMIEVSSGRWYVTADYD